MRNIYLRREIKWGIKSLRTFKIVFLILFFGIGNSYSQRFSSEVWHEGQAITSSADTLYGKMKYDLKRNILQLEIQNGIQVLSPRNTLSFIFQDNIIERKRVFYSLPLEDINRFEKFMFFEVMVEGELTLLSRERIEFVARPTGFYGYSPISSQELVYDNYLLRREGKLFKITGTKSEILNLSGAKKSQIKKYMKQKRLKPKNQRDLAQIIAYYNSI